MDVLSCSYDLRFSIFPFSCGSPRSYPGYFHSHVFLDFGSQIPPVLFSSPCFLSLSPLYLAVWFVFFFLFLLSLLLSLLFTPLPLFVSCTTAWCLHTLTGLKPGRFAKRGVLGLLSFAERGSFLGFGRLELFLTYLIASHERVFSFSFSMCSVCSSNFCVHAVLRLSACLLSYPGPLYMVNGRSWTRIREQIQDTGLLCRYEK